jgi:hypothetical protein
MKLHVLALLLAVLVAPFTNAWGHASTSRSTAARTSVSKPRAAKPKARSTPRATTNCTSCARDSRSRIARNATVKHDFQKSHPCPSTGKATGACKGYVIDHVLPLKRGGADAVGNTQWQTVQAAKAKDKVE